MVDFDPVPKLNGAPIPTLPLDDNKSELWASGRVLPLVAATITIPRTALPVGCTKPTQIRRFRIEEYWRAVLDARPLPPDLDRQAILANLSRSPANSTRYPHTHLWWRQNRDSKGVGKSRKVVLHISKWIDGRTSCFERGDRCPFRLPSREDLYTMFILGNTVGKGKQKVVVHYAFSKPLRIWIEKARLQFRLPELGIPLINASDYHFWDAQIEEDEKGENQRGENQHGENQRREEESIEEDDSEEDDSEEEAEDGSDSGEEAV